MATNETTKPEDEKTTPATETQTTEQAAPVNEQLNIDNATPPTDTPAQEAAATPQAEERNSNKDDKIVPPNSTEKPQAAQDKKPAEEKAPEQNPPEQKQPRPGRPPKADKADKPAPKSKPAKAADEKKSGGGKRTAKTTGEEKPKTPKATEKAEPKQPDPPAPPPEPTEAPRTGEQEQIVYLNLSELHPFKNHPFQVRQDAEMTAMVESVKDKGVTQPAIVRPRESGGYELVSGHRRQKASELANYTNMPCIIRNLTDEQAITQMVEDNTNQRENILPSERANALKMQLDAIKRQGAREGNGNGEKGQRSNEIVADRNKMTVKQVQRYIKLTELVPDLQKMVDDKKIAFTPAVELAFIKPKNQNYIAVAIEGNESAPSLSQAQRMRELDQKGVLNPDMIDGIMMEEKKEVDKVILSSKELAPFFAPEQTPREMKEAIIKLLDENRAKNPPELTKPPKEIKLPTR